MRSYIGFILSLPNPFYLETVPMVTMVTNLKPRENSYHVETGCRRWIVQWLTLILVGTDLVWVREVRNGLFYDNFSHAPPYNIFRTPT